MLAISPFFNLSAHFIAKKLTVFFALALYKTQESPFDSWSYKINFSMSISLDLYETTLF